MKKQKNRNFPMMAVLCTLVNFSPLFMSQPTWAHENRHIQQVQTLKLVLNQISNHYKVTFLFEESIIQSKSTAYQFNAKANKSINQTLQELLTPLGLKTSKVDEQHIAIIPQIANPVVSTPVNSQGNKTVQPSNNSTSPVTNDPTVSGATETTTIEPLNTKQFYYVKGRVVSDVKEEPIPGVSVQIKNTNEGTTTDADGYFAIKVPTGARLLSIRHVNFTPREVAISINNFINVRLSTKIKELKEVVVVNTGMFKKNKETFTGSYSVITGDQIRSANMTNALDALKVFDPAVRIPDNVQFGSDPNRLPTIVLRGTNNFPEQTTSQTPSSGGDFMANYINNPNQPLFILDGFEVSLQRIYDLDINRIENFTILKDAAATAIYGSRAANGVIVVDTKQPAPGKFRVSYSGVLQVADPDLTVYNLTNAQEKLEVERLAGLYNIYSNGIRPDADAVLRNNYAIRKTAVERGINTDWLSIPVRTGFGQRHSLYLEGGDNYIRYGIDLGYNNVAGVMKNSDRTTLNGGMNLSYRRKGLLFKNTLSIINNVANNSNYGSFGDYSKQNPFWTPYDSAGKIVKILESVAQPLGGTVNYTNPLFNTTVQTIDKSQYTNIINQTNFEWLLTKGFRVTARFQVTQQNDRSDRFLPAQHTSFDAVTDIARRGSYTKGSGNFSAYDGTLQAEYNKTVGKHQFNNATGTSIQQTKSEFMSVLVEGFPNDRLNEIAFGNGYPPNSKPTYRKDVSRLLSFHSNFGYSYDLRYNLDFSIRSDGSSQFGSNKRFGTFWSAGASWNIYKESFLKGSKTVNMARLRASVGTTGGNKFPPFMGISSYNYYTDQNFRGLNGATLAGYGNPDLQWQQTYKKNVGADFGFWKNRITASVDVYHEITTNLILDFTTPPSLGFSSYKQNIGELENKGIEFKINSFLIRQEKSGFYWNVIFMGLHNTDRIKKISNSLNKLNQANDQGNQTLPLFRYKEGQSVNTIWAVESLGIDPSTGREVFKKADGTITYNWNAADKVAVGNTVPTLRGSIGSNMFWKGFSLGVYFAYEFGGDNYNQTLIDRVEVTSYTYNVDRRVLLGRWQKPGDVTYFKGLVDENGRSVTTATNATSRFVQNNDFVNLETISLSYILPEKWSKKLRLSNTRIGLNTNDIVRWTTIQVERGLVYPFARNYTLNLSTTF